MAGRMINGAAALAQLVRPAGDTGEGGLHRVLPVVPELSGLLPARGLRRGSTVAVATGRAAPGSGGTSLLLALLSAASRSGSWCAVVGVPALGALAAAESGIALDRLALVPNPGPEWPTVVAALIDGIDVVVTAVPGPVSAAVAGRLAARARQRGSVLVPFGSWDGADVTLQVQQGRWEGLGSGRGRLRRRRVTVVARGRGAAARPKEITMWMPGITTPPAVPPPPAALPAAVTSPAEPSPASSAAVSLGVVPGPAAAGSSPSPLSVASPSGASRSGASPSGASPSGASRSGASPSGASPSVASPSWASPSGAALFLASPSGASPSASARKAAPGSSSAPPRDAAPADRPTVASAPGADAPAGRRRTLNSVGPP